MDGGARVCVCHCTSHSVMSSRLNPELEKSIALIATLEENQEEDAQSKQDYSLYNKSLCCITEARDYCVLMLAEVKLLLCTSALTFHSEKRGIASACRLSESDCDLSR